MSPLSARGKLRSLANSLLRRGARILYPYGAIRRVWLGPLRGTRFVVQQGVAATVAFGLDNLNLGFLSSRIQPGQVIYDIGANHGQTSIFFSRQTGPSGSVHAFEPVPVNVEMLNRNLGLNGIRNVTVHTIALADQPGARRFLFDPERHTMGVLAETAVKMRDWQAGFEVRCDSIDHLLAQGMPVPDLLKIDVEGAGAGVLRGAEKLLSDKPPAIYFELHALTHEAPEVAILTELQSRWHYTVTDITGMLEMPAGEHWGAAVWCAPPSTTPDTLPA